MYSILVVDDDRETCRFITELLAADDRRIVSEQTPAEALRRFRSERIDLMVSDINLNASHYGLDLLRAFRAENPDGQVLLISGFGTLETAIEAVRAGAFDYISKPFDIAEVKAMVARALAHVGSVDAAPPAAAGPARACAGAHRPHGRRCSRSTSRLRDAADSTRAGADPRRERHRQGARRARHPRATARARRGRSSRSTAARFPKRCSSRSCSATRAARSPAPSPTARASSSRRRRHGLPRRDRRDIAGASGAGCCGCSRKGKCGPSAPARTIKVDARVIAATNRDLEQAVAAQRFRQDLFYRLSVIVIRVPPLRERRDDIPLLAGQFLTNACARTGRAVEIAPDALDALAAYDWPGNVRELENTIERLVLFSRGASIHAADLPPAISAVGATTQLHTQLFTDLPSLDELERRYLLHVLQAVGGNRTRAAEVLGIDRRTLYRMAIRFGLNLPHVGEEE